MEQLPNSASCFSKPFWLAFCIETQKEMFFTMSKLLLTITWECMFTTHLTHDYIIYIYILFVLFFLLLVYFSLNVFLIISFCVLQKWSSRTGTKWWWINGESFSFALNTALSETWWWRGEQSTFSAPALRHSLLDIQVAGETSGKHLHGRQTCIWEDIIHEI